MGATFTIATLSSCVGATYRIVASTMARSLVGVMKKPFFNLVYPATIGGVFDRRCILPARTSLPLHTKSIYRSRSTGRKAPRRPRYFPPIVAGHTRLCDSHPAESLKSGSTIDKGLPFKQIRITAASLSVHSIRVIPQHPIPCHFRILCIHQKELHDWGRHH